MSLATRVKEEPGCAVTEQVCMKEEPDLTAAGCIHTKPEHVHTKEQPVCVQQEAAHAKEEPMAICVKDEPVGVGGMPACVKEEPPWPHCAGAGPGHEFTFEIPLLPPAETRDVKPNMSVRDCWVRVERCVVPRGAARRAAAAAAASSAAAAAAASAAAAAAAASARRAAAARRGASTAAPGPGDLSGEHERELAMKQLSGLLFKPIYKNKKVHICEICKKDFKHLADLTVHKEVHLSNIRMKTKIIHWPKTPSPCLGAPRAAARPPRSGDSFACEVCSAAFNDFDSFKDHALSHLNQRAPYVCDVCSKPCVSPYSLKLHKRFHEESRSFACDNCQKRFTRLCDLSKHKVARHREKEGLCKVCEAKRAQKQLENLLTSELLPSQENTDFCECSKTVP